MEFWDLYDKDRNLLKGSMRRGEPQPAGTFHLVVHVCIFDSNGDMLIQHRQPFKDGWPDRWDLTVGGSAVRGDNSQAAAERETMEEIGCALNLTDERPALTLHFDGGFDDIYLLTKDLSISSLALQPEEVSEVKWASLQEICERIDDGRFIPYHKALIELLFHLKDYRTAHTRSEQPE